MSSTRYVALFRGINVGKAKRIAMADLRALLGQLGYRDVKTLLNSGNAVFTGGGEASSRHAARIRAAVAVELGIDAFVIVKSARDVAAIVKGNALSSAVTDPSKLLVAMTADARSLSTAAPLAGRAWGAEKVHLGRHAAYLLRQRHPRKQGRPILLGALQERGTTRNWATLGKIHASLAGAGGAPPDER